MTSIVAAVGKPHFDSVDSDTLFGRVAAELERFIAELKER